MAPGPVPDTDFRWAIKSIRRSGPLFAGAINPYPDTGKHRGIPCRYTSAAQQSFCDRRNRGQSRLLLTPIRYNNDFESCFDASFRPDNARLCRGCCGSKSRQKGKECQQLAQHSVPEIGITRPKVQTQRRIFSP